MNNNCINILEQSKFKFDSNITTIDIKSQNFEIIQTGIGDILYNELLIKNRITQAPLYINLACYIDNPYLLNNPLQNFTFLLKLLSFFNDESDIIFYYDKNISSTKWENKLHCIKDNSILQKNINFVNLFDTEYIVFHTKCRFTGSFNYSELKQNVYTFSKNFKTKYKIIIWGEQIMPHNLETDVHNIQTIYDELQELKHNNDVLDLSQKNIYDNQDFDNYLKLLNLYNKSKTNIIFGMSGATLASTICFGNHTIAFIGDYWHDMDYIFNNNDLCNNIELCENYNVFFNLIEKTCN